MLGQIIPLLSKSWTSCFIFFCMAGSNDLGLAVIGNGYTRLILCLRTFVRPRSSLCWATTSLNKSSNLFTDVGSWFITCLASTGFSADEDRLFLLHHSRI